LKPTRAETAYYREPSTPTTYYQGFALLSSGAVTISSRKYNLQYSTGRYIYI
jgi:hypothetical protein